MLSASLELTTINPSIWPFLDAVSILFVIFKLTFINSSISISQYPFAMLLIVLPLAGVFSTIWPAKSSMTMSHRLEVMALIVRAIGPLLSSLTLLFILIKITLINSCQIGIKICTFAMGFGIDESAHEHVAIGQNIPAITICFIILPKSLVDSSIWPKLLTIAFFDFFLGIPLTRVNGTLWKFIVDFPSQSLNFMRGFDFVPITITKFEHSKISFFLSYYRNTTLWNLFHVIIR